MFTKNKLLTILILLVVVLLSGWIGFKSLNPATPNYDDLSKVNVTNQMKHIQEIAKEPHSIYDVLAKEKVRNYLISQLETLGLQPTLFEYDDVYVERSDSYEDLQNIYATLEGTSDSYIMLVTHYDSSRAKPERYAEMDGSLGAADAGYGLSTILETLRVIKENNKPLVNGIKILFTDGEEYGLLGAKQAVNESEIFEGVNYLINIEARGTKGPAVMFETSPNNAAIVDLFKQSEHPFSYSITPEIYRLLPNGTDFTVFLQHDLPGINISVLDGLENYHTPNDNPNNLSDASLQHYGDQVLPIVESFVYSDTYSDANALISSDDSIFFTFGPSFINYSKTINYLLIATIMVLILFLLKKLHIQKLMTVFKYTFLNTGFTLLMMGLSYLLTRLVALLNGRPFKLTYLPLMKHEDFILIAVIFVTFVAYFLLIRKITHRFKESSEFFLGSLVFLLVLSLIITFVLPGASYLMVCPAFLMALFASIKVLLNGNWASSYLLFIPIAFVIILFVPTIYLFNAALTLGGLVANMLFIMIAFISILSSLSAMNEF